MRWRPWRLAAGVLFGLAVASKWSALIPLAGFGLLVLAWDTGARRALGVRWALLKTSVADGLLAFGYLVVVALVVYVASWTGWLMHADLLEQQFATNAYGPYWGDYVTDDPDRVLALARRRPAQPVALPRRGLVVPHRRAARRRPTPTSPRPRAG